MSDKISEALDEIDWEGDDEAAHGGALVALKVCVQVAEDAHRIHDEVVPAIKSLLDAFKATFHAPDGEE